MSNDLSQLNFQSRHVKNYVCDMIICGSSDDGRLQVRECDSKAILHTPQQ
jgi:hypothetical protein